MRSVQQIKNDIAQRQKDQAPLIAKVLEGQASESEVAEFRTKRTELETLQGELSDAQRSEQERNDDVEWARRMQAENEQRNRPGRNLAQVVPGSDARGLGAPDGDQGDHRSLGRRFVESETYRTYRDHQMGQHTRSGRFAAGELADLDRRALINTPVVDPLIQPQRLPGIIEPDRMDLRLRDVFPSLRTTSNLVEFVKEGTRTNGAAEVAEATSLSTGAKPESGFALTEGSAAVVTIATIMYVTRTAAEDVAQLEGYIDQLLRRFVDERVDAQLLNGSGVSPNLLGIRNASGVQVLNDAWFATNAPDLTMLDRIRRGKTKVRKPGRGRADFMVINPEDLETIETIKTNTSDEGNQQYAFGGPFRTVPPSPWGLSVIETEQQPAGEAVIGDRRAAAIFDRNDGQLYLSDSNRDLFERNILTMLYEVRLAFPIFRPETLAKVDLTVPAV